MFEFFHKDVNSNFASPTWFDISAKLEALSEATTGNQYLTWGTQGFKTVFDFITVRNCAKNKLSKASLEF
jgi:hypothetical protein